MHILNLFVIPIILLSLFYEKTKLAYIVALLCSLTAATFVYTQHSFINLLFIIAAFSVTPIACLRLKDIVRLERVSLVKKKTSEKNIYEQMLKERTLIRQANSQLDSEISQVAELYRLVRDMSAVLDLEGIFNILSKKLMEHFHFQRCRFISIDEKEDPLKIEKVFELSYVQAYPRQVSVEAADEMILKQSCKLQKVTFTEEKSICLAPIIVDSKFLGVLAVEGLSVNLLENFSILVNQFSLEFKRIMLYRKIQELAITDGLTGLFVRRYFLQRLEEELQRSTRHNFELGFLMIDIDHFKRCNDRFGHLTGDAVLRETAKVILTCVREIDLVCRFGGEEFSVLLPDTNRDGLKNAAERIRTSIAKHQFPGCDESIKIEVSIGGANFPRHADTIQDLIDKSDQALYRAKQEGRNRVRMFVK